MYIDFAMMSNDLEPCPLSCVKVDDTGRADAVAESRAARKGEDSKEKGGSLFRIERLQQYGTARTGAACYGPGLRQAGRGMKLAARNKEGRRPAEG